MQYARFSENTVKCPAKAAFCGTVRNFTRYTRRYRISEVHGIEWPVELVTVAQTTSLRGPIRKHEDLLKLIDMSSHATVLLHICAKGVANELQMATKVICHQHTK